MVEHSPKVLASKEEKPLGDLEGLTGSPRATWEHLQAKEFALKGPIQFKSLAAH